MPATWGAPCLSRFERHNGFLASLQILELDHAVQIPGLHEPRGLKRDVLAVAICARNAIYGNLVLRAALIGLHCSIVFCIAR